MKGKNDSIEKTGRLSFRSAKVRYLNLEKNLEEKP